MLKKQINAQEEIMHTCKQHQPQNTAAVKFT